MMKHIFSVIVLLPFFVRAQVCTISLDIDTIQAKKAYLIYKLGDRSIIDSPDIQNGKARFQANIPYPVHAQLSLDNRGYGYANGQKPDLLRLFLEKGRIHIKTKKYIRDAVITGSTLNRELTEYNKFIAEPIHMLEEANYVFVTGGDDYRKDSIHQREFNEAMGKGVDWMKELQEQWITAHPDARCSLDALQSIAGSNMNAEKVDSLYQLLAPSIRNSVEGKDFGERIAAARNTAIGAMAPAFTQHNVEGKPVQLSDFRGKYVLIDFWASWCGPCRAENPNYVKAYDQYKNKNFTILGVSLDREGDKAAWVKAIEKDGLTWPQVSDLKYWNNGVAKLYDVKAVPSNFLVDPSGKIIARNLRGEELQRKLAAIFNVDSSFIVKGYLAGEQQEKKIYLRYHQRVDSAIIKNGRFEFKGFTSEPVYASMWCEKKDENRNYGDNLEFYIEPAQVTITSINSLNGAIVNGGQTQSEQQVFNKLFEPLTEQRSALNIRKYNYRDNEDSVKALTKEIMALNERYNQQQVHFVNRFPDSYVSYALVRDNAYAINPNVLEPMLNAIHPRFKDLPETKDIAKRLEIAKRTWIGQPALEFTQKDVNGKPVSLKSFRGKYVMVDFWASWCGWCRIEHPTLIKAYNKYKDKGFTILSVSLDDAREKDKWIAAIKKDELPWQQVSDLKGRENEVAKMYGIKGIPQSVIVGPDGIIVAKNLRGDDLLIKLDEIFGY